MGMTLQRWRLLKIEEWLLRGRWGRILRYAFGIRIILRPGQRLSLILGAEEGPFLLLDSQVMVDI